jgi:hypothetical protein
MIAPSSTRHRDRDGTACEARGSTATSFHSEPRCVGDIFECSYSLGNISSIKKESNNLAHTTAGAAA